MSHAVASVSSSPLSSTSPSPSSGQPSIADDEPTSNPVSQSHSARTTVIVGTVGGVCALFMILLTALLFWKKRKRRLLREQQIAIRRMTIVGPPSSSSSSPPILPYPFLGYGPRTGTFTRGFEMSTSKEFTDGKLREAGLPKTKPALPPRPSEPDRAVRRNEQTLTAGSAAADSVSVFGSKQSDVGDSDGIAFVDGTYVLTLEHDDNHISVDRKVASMSPRGPT